ncbi:NAD(P)-dependent alcohol dehydrogenase [Cohnella xylanilytica]|uniref:NAD(P)-dependent alcohol dehydrogenase n=1 Tax=Cohnella xylanilytica TaxID=557555 RepID=A0A841TWE2_9BACL|nr:NAD(P)-dependent alcohol dehydrogenase [Cohnella xylanilytica]MBB6690281.1 NAD(P)-dependent alcohol dehydrogenase [Cohnella xylanilytica]
MSVQALPGLPKTIRAAILNRPMEVETIELPMPEIGPDEVLVKVMAVGVCGSDVHYYEHGRIGPYVVEAPLILGHECAGIVAAAGEKATRFRPGDRVAIEPGVVCGRCDACKSGRYNLCPSVKFLATPPVHGAFAQYIAMREDFLFPIPDSLSFEEAAMNEPFSVGIHAAKRAGLQPGTTLAVMGMGPVGLMAVVAAKAFGVAEIIVADLEPIRLEAALRLGAAHAINIRERDPLAEIKRLTGGAGVDAAFETAGNPKALQTALLSLKRGGKLSIVGLPPQDGIELNVPFIADNEVDIYGVFRYANTYPQGIAFLSSGIADVASLITDRYPLEKAGEALERARTNKSGSLKVMVYPNGIE